MSNQFKLFELKSENGDKDYFIEGYISTTDPDFVNDIVDEEGQAATFRELNGADITMDLDHDEWRDLETGEVYDGKKNKLPIARVVDKRLDRKGTWVRAKLNKYHPKFKDEILPSIKDKFLHSFSIAYNVVKGFDKVINNVKHRVIQDLKLANIAITGNPVNKNATFNIALKALDKKMAEENKYQELETQFTELKSQKESLEKELAEIKGMDYKKKYEEMKAKYDEMMKEKEDNKKKAETKSMTELKSVQETIESQKKEIADLKSVVDKIRETPATSAGAKQPAQPQEVADINFKSLVGVKQ